MLFGFSRRNVVRPASQKSRRAALKRRRLLFDHLEDRRLLSAGTLAAPSSEFQISPPPATAQLDGQASVASDSAGDQVVAWSQKQSSGSWNMKFQEYTNNAGTLLAASPVTVASNITGALHGNDAPRIQVARAPAGQFVVVWETNSISGSGTDTYTTHAQLYSASGKATGKSLVVGSDAFVMSVAMNNNGFDVLYGAHAGGKRYFNGGWTMTEQRYNSAGSALGSAVSVTSVGIPEHLAGSIAMDGNSDSVVVWNYETSNPSTGQPLFTIEAQPLNSSGAPTTSVIAVSGSASNAVGGGTVAMDPTTGEFVVPWTQTVPVPTGRAADDLYANQYQLNGTLVQQVSVATPTYASVVETNGTTYYYPTAGDVGDTTGVATLPGGAFDLSWTNVYETMTPASTPSGYTATAYTNIMGPIFESGPISIVDGRPGAAESESCSRRRRERLGSARGSSRGDIQGNVVGNDAACP